MSMRGERHERTMRRAPREVRGCREHSVGCLCIEFERADSWRRFQQVLDIVDNPRIPSLAALAQIRTIILAEE
jgi:hypothetical protein